MTLQNLRAESDARYRLRLEEIQAKRKGPHFSPEELFTDALAKCRTGHFAAWTTLCYALSQPKSEHDTSDFFRHSDLRQLAGWAETSEELQTEITEFARQFLLHVEVPMPEPRTVPWSFFGLAYALSLHHRSLQTDKELNAAIRPIWPLALLRHSDSQSNTIAEALGTLTTVAPPVVADACRHEFRERWERNEPIYDQLLSAAWCPETEGALASILVSKPLQPETYISGLAMLAGYNAELAEQVATRRLTEHVTLAEDSAQRRAAIAVCLFLIVGALGEGLAPFARQPYRGTSTPPRIQQVVGLPRAGTTHRGSSCPAGRRALRSHDGTFPFERGSPPRRRLYSDIVGRRLQFARPFAAFA